jgi:hypothetical protein
VSLGSRLHCEGKSYKSDAQLVPVRILAGIQLHNSVSLHSGHLRCGHLRYSRPDPHSASQQTDKAYTYDNLRVSDVMAQTLRDYCHTDSRHVGREHPNLETCPDTLPQVQAVQAICPEQTFSTRQDQPIPAYSCTADDLQYFGARCRHSQVRRFRS